jgi:hypothetical protein
MPSTATYRLDGLSTSVAVKAPVKIVATSNITLYGEQTVNGVAVTEGDRVLCIAQDSSIDNGIYEVSTSAWGRAPDFDGPRDVRKGTLVVSNGDSSIYYRVVSDDAIVIGSNAVLFEPVAGAVTQSSIGLALYPRTAAEVAAGVTPTNYYYPPGNVLRYGTNTNPGTTDMTAAIQAAANVAAISGGRVVFQKSSYVCDNTVALSNKSGVEFYGENAVLVLPASPSTAVPYCFDFNACTDIRVTGLRFSRSQSTTAGQNHNGVRIRSCQRIRIENCDFSDCDIGIAIWAESADTYDIAVDRCSATGVLAYNSTDDANRKLQGELIYIQDGGAYHCTDIAIRNCTAIKCDKLVLAEAGAERISVENNIVRESHDSSIYLRATGLSVKGNTIYHAGKDGIKALTVGAALPKRVVITNNNVYGAGVNKSDGGVLINSDAVNCAIIGNALETTSSAVASSTQVGIFVSNSDTNVTGNTIVGNSATSKGIYVRTNIGDINAVRIEGNVVDLVSGSIGCAVEYTNSRYIRNCAITDNTFKGGANGIYINDGASGTYIEDILIDRNKITGCTSDFISLRGLVRPVITNNEMNASTGTFFVRIGAASDVVMVDNRCDASAAFRTVTGATPTYVRRYNNLRSGVDQDAFVAMTAGDTTPSVDGCRSIKTANASATTVTALDDGYAGMDVVVLIDDANTTVDFTGTTLKGNGGADWSPGSGDFMRCVYNGTNWYCTVSDATA